MPLRVGTTLLNWYHENRILYPWRRTDEPYPVWLSEVLLQQTRIPVVLAYYEKILKLFPNLESLAGAKDEDFLSAWSGIGYYNRARNMLLCAREVVSRHEGKFPSDLTSLLRLPGIGLYTAGALRNLCFGQLTPAIDGNISRVLARITNNRKFIHTTSFRDEVAAYFLQAGKGLPPAHYFQAWMELGETICLPQPNCSQCPLRMHCKAFLHNAVTQVPQIEKRKKGENHYWYFLLLKDKQRYFYTRNTRRPFLKEAWLFPDLLEQQPLTNAQLKKEFESKWDVRFSGKIQRRTLKHTVTFRKLVVDVVEPVDFTIRQPSGRWISPVELRSFPTSSIVYKILNAEAQRSSAATKLPAVRRRPLMPAECRRSLSKPRSAATS